MNADNNIILTADAIDKKIERIAYEIYERNSSEEEIILAGVMDKGNVVAEKIRQALQRIAPFRLVMLDIALDKSDPLQVKISEDMDFTGKVIILVDDVANSGRTLWYATKPLLAYLPKKIQTVVLIDRRHKSFPLQIDYSGYSLATTLQDTIEVQIENGSIKQAYLA